MGEVQGRKSNDKSNKHQRKNAHLSEKDKITDKLKAKIRKLNNENETLRKRQSKLKDKLQRCVAFLNKFVADTEASEEKENVTLSTKHFRVLYSNYQQKTSI